MVTMEQLVPKDNLVRKIDSAIEFEFIRDEVAHLYCTDNGRPNSRPCLLIQNILLGYIFGGKRERQLSSKKPKLMLYIIGSFAFLSLKGYPCLDTQSNRIRRFNGTDFFKRIFINIVIQAVTRGLVAGEELFTDSTNLKANLNKNKHTNKQTAFRASTYLDM